MDITQWYAVALAAIAALSIVFYMLGISIGFLRTYATYRFLKHVFYPRVHKYIRGTTRYHALLILALLVGNVVCLMAPTPPTAPEARLERLVPIRARWVGRLAADGSGGGTGPAGIRAAGAGRYHRAQDAELGSVGNQVLSRHRVVANAAVTEVLGLQRKVTRV